jgi:hypothetical protein
LEVRVETCYLKEAREYPNLTQRELKQTAHHHPLRNSAFLGFLNYKSEVEAKERGEKERIKYKWSGYNRGKHEWDRYNRSKYEWSSYNWAKEEWTKTE